MEKVRNDESNEWRRKDKSVQKTQKTQNRSKEIRKDEGVVDKQPHTHENINRQNFND